MIYTLSDSDAMVRFGAALYAACPPTAMIHLHGPLGAGKTTLVRGFLHAAGASGAIKSPTYTLVEPYQLGGRDFYHFDLYRLESPEALEMLGFRDYLNVDSVCLIEWPERAAGLLPAADITVHIAMAGDGRSVSLAAHSEQGVNLLKSFEFLK